MKLFEEFKLYETMWAEGLVKSNGKLEWNNTPEGLDKNITICDNCGKKVTNGTLPLERNRPVQVGMNDQYLFSAFGKNLCCFCVWKDPDLDGLEQLTSKVRDFQTAIDHFNKGDLSSFEYSTGKYTGPNKIYDWWAANKDQLNYSQSEKSAIETVITTHKQMFNSKEYQDYLKELEAKYKAYEEDEAKKAALRTPKSTVKRNSYIYMALQDFADGSFNIVCVDKKLAIVKRQFKEAIFDFIVDGVDADEKMFLLKINIAAIQDTRLLDLFKEYLGDDYPAEVSDEHQELLYEYRHDFWNSSWAQSLLECYDNEAIEECYVQGLDPNDFITNGTWEDFVRDYIDRTYKNI